MFNPIRPFDFCTKNCFYRVFWGNDWNRHYLSFTVTITNWLTDTISMVLYTSDMFPQLYTRIVVYVENRNVKVVKIKKYQSIGHGVWLKKLNTSELVLIHLKIQRFINWMLFRSKLVRSKNMQKYLQKGKISII